MRGHIAKKGKRYYPVTDVGRDPATGRRKQKWHEGYGTKREAEARLADIVRDLRQGNYVAPSRRTLADFVSRDWLPSLESKLRPGTIALHELNCRAYLLPRLGGTSLQEVSPRDLQTLYADLLKDGRRDGKGLSASAVKNVHKTARRIFQDAQRMGLRQGSPVESVEPPTVRTPETETWTASELKRFLEAAAPDRLYAAWLLAATTGMRRGEILGLRWVDVALDRVSIRSTLVLVKNVPMWSEPKTPRSRRSIPLAAETSTALRAHRKAQAEERLLMGAAFSDSDLVFCQADGSFIHPSTFTATFQRLARDAGVPKRKIHAVRHTFATLALEAGVHPKVVSEILGHSSVAITLDLYTHAVQSLQENATSKVAALVFGERG